MKNFIALSTVMALLIGCSNAASSQASKERVSFIETNESGQKVRELQFVLANEPLKTCISGNWKKAKVVADKENYTKSPAYKLENGRLEVLLVNAMCDVYDSYEGKLVGGTFDGNHVTYGLGFSKTLGKVVGTYSP